MARAFAQNLGVDVFDQFWADARADGAVDEAAQKYKMSSFILQAEQ